MFASSLIFLFFYILNYLYISTGALTRIARAILVLKCVNVLGSQWLAETCRLCAEFFSVESGMHACVCIYLPIYFTYIGKSSSPINIDGCHFMIVALTFLCLVLLHIKNSSSIYDTKLITMPIYLPHKEFIKDLWYQVHNKMMWVESPGLAPLFRCFLGIIWLFIYIYSYLYQVNYQQLEYINSSY